MHKVIIYGMFFFSSKGHFNIFVKIKSYTFYLPMKEITEVYTFGPSGKLHSNDVNLIFVQHSLLSSNVQLVFLLWQRQKKQWVRFYAHRISRPYQKVIGQMLRHHLKFLLTVFFIKYLLTRMNLNSLLKFHYFNILITGFNHPSYYILFKFKTHYLLRLFSC